MLTNDQDGLGAAAHFRKAGCLRSSCECRLSSIICPLRAAASIVVIFNASFHYSENYETTLRRGDALYATRRFDHHCGYSLVLAGLKAAGRWSASGGAHFTARYGFASDAIPSREYLTDHDLELLRDRFAIEWKLYTPYYGVRWLLRPLLAKLRRRREPSRFRIYAAEVRG